MPLFSNRTGYTNRVSGVYRSSCHNGERTVLEGQVFPRCGFCDEDASWILIGPMRVPAKCAWRAEPVSWETPERRA
jgi:hypothetical protein